MHINTSTSRASGRGAEMRLSIAQMAKAAGFEGIADSLTNGKMGEMEAAMSLVDKLTRVVLPDGSEGVVP